MLFPYAAATWAFGHAFLSFYRGSGGSAGLDTLSDSLEASAANGDSACSRLCGRRAA